MRQRVAVIGAGIIGLLTARELVARGHRVLLLDRGQPGREASWAGGGIVSPLYPWRYGDAVSALAADAQAAHAMLSRELRAATGIDPEYNPCGLLMLDPADTGDALAWCRRRRRRVIACDRAAIDLVQPGAAPGARAALWMPDVGNVRNPRLLRALLADLAPRDDVACRWNATVALDADNGALRVDGERVDVDASLVCAGAWSAALLAPLGVRLAIEPVRGQMLQYPPMPGALRTMLLADGRYLIPRRDGRILAGSTLEFTGFDKSVTGDARKTLRAAAAAMLPALASVEPERQWAGLRPGAPAGIPYIDRVPGTNVWVNAGHFRNGLVIAPAASRLGVQLLLGETPAVDPAPYALGAPRGTRWA